MSAIISNLASNAASSGLPGVISKFGPLSNNIKNLVSNSDLNSASSIASKLRTPLGNVLTENASSLIQSPSQPLTSSQSSSPSQPPSPSQPLTSSPSVPDDPLTPKDVIVVLNENLDDILSEQINDPESALALDIKKIVREFIEEKEKMKK